MTKLQKDIDIFAGRIQDAAKACDLLNVKTVEIKQLILTIKQAARGGLDFQFPGRTTKGQLRTVLASMSRMNELLNSAEPGSRGLVAKQTFQRLWRELP